MEKDQNVNTEEQSTLSLSNASNNIDWAMFVTSRKINIKFI